MSSFTKMNFNIINNDKNNYFIKINDKVARTPKGNIIELPSLKLSKIILKEYKLYKNKMPSSIISPIRITNTAIDKIKLDYNHYLDQLSFYANNDVICYFSKTPDELVKKQKKLWMPLINFMKEIYNIDIIYTSEIAAIKQSKESLLLIRNILISLNNFQLAAISVLSQLTNSIIIPLVLVNGKITAKKAFELSYLEEIYQSSLWGKDEEAFNRLHGISLDIRNVNKYYGSVFE